MSTKTKPTEHGTWTKIINFVQSTLNTSRDGADIGDLELQSCSNFIFDNGVLEKAGGLTKVNVSPLESGAPIMGVFRSHDTYGNKVLLTMCNGKLKRWNGSAFVDVEIGLSPNARSDFLNWKDSTIMVDGVDEAREFSPRTNVIQKFGVEPPRFYRKISYFESDETIVHDVGNTTDTTFIKITERTGKSKVSLKLTAGSGLTTASYVSFASAENFSIFPNGMSITDSDLISINILHRTRAYVNEIYVDFWTSADNYFRLTINRSDLDPINEQDNRWTNIVAPVASCVPTGSPSWSNINRVYYSLSAQGGEAIVYIDNVHFINTPIIVSCSGRMIEDYEGSTGEWSVSPGTVITHELIHKKTGYKALNMAGLWTPSGPNLIGWYKFNEGSGVIVNNYAPDGSSGGGLLPNLSVYNAGGNFWTANSGFATVSLITNPTTYAYKLLSSARELGGAAKHSFGIFYKQTIAGTLGTWIWNLHEIFNGAERGMSPHNPDVNDMTFANSSGIACWLDETFIADQWNFFFIDDTGRGYQVNANGTLSIGFNTMSLTAPVIVNYIHVGCQYSTNPPGTGIGFNGAGGTFADFIIYNLTTLTIAQWAQWYDALRSRYGMAARSGW